MSLLISLYLPAYGTRGGTAQGRSALGICRNDTLAWRGATLGSWQVEIRRICRGAKLRRRIATVPGGRGNRRREGLPWFYSDGAQQGGCHSERADAACWHRASLSARDGQAAVPAPSLKPHREAPVGAADPETAQATGCCSYPRREGYRRIPANAA